MPSETTGGPILEGLNDQQRQAVQHDRGPLLIVAGAGTGKTRTLVHRVAHLIQEGTAPSRILLLTFTRRAAAEMLRRVDALMRVVHADGQRHNGGAWSRAVWGGTFHGTAARLLRVYALSAGLEPDFTILDRSDSEDLLDISRTELSLPKSHQRFPRKGACLAIYSHCVNAQRPIEDVLTSHYPWCRDFADDLKRLFLAYGESKEQGAILDYDDLLLFWQGLLADPQVGGKIRSRFDYVLVDEYQDTNQVQAEILRLLRPDGQGLSAVGDDAQSIYSFRAATVRNILEFPDQFAGTTIVKLEQNYRSTQPILEATNQVIAQARNRFVKNLWSARTAGDKPHLVACLDESDQAEYLVREILQRREEGTDLRHQAVLYRASHHSVLLEGELTRRNIPYVKYGGLKFLESAHIKDLLSFLRLAENPRDLVAGSRILQLVPGIGPKRARTLMDMIIQSGGNIDVWSKTKVTDAAKETWPAFQKMMGLLMHSESLGLASQIDLVRRFYEPLLEQKYDNAGPRKRDLEQLELLSARFADRQTMLTEMTLDPPESTQDFAGPPLLDEDYLILSTMHSAKGLEWDTVYVIHAADGNIPSDMATGSAEEIEEELRLFYVGLTRTREQLHVCHPLRYYHAGRGAFSDKHGYAQRTRFIPPKLTQFFGPRVSDESADGGAEQPAGDPTATPRRIRSQIQSLFS